MRIRTAALFRAASLACLVTTSFACDKCEKTADPAENPGKVAPVDAGLVLLPVRGEDATERKVSALEQEIDEDDRLEPKTDAGP